MKRKIGKIYRGIRFIIRKIIQLLRIKFQNVKLDITCGEAQKYLDDYHHDVHSSCYVDGKNESDEKDLSIIIPTYNNEAFIEQCIESVKNQKTDYAMEIVVINDGSKDHTEQILEKYESDECIRIITQQNKGFSGARNTGIDLARGKYIMFVDSDDMLLADAIENLMKVAIENDADVVAGGYRRVYQDGRVAKIVTYQDEKVDPQGVYHGEPWGKVYKRNLFEHLRFPLGYLYEDSIFAQIVWPLCKNCYTISRPVYDYVVNEQGISKTSRGTRKCVDSLYITQALLEDKKKYGLTLGQADYEYFLDMVRLTYTRTKEREQEVRKCIFIIQCSLKEKYFSGYTTQKQSKEKLEKSLKNKSYKSYAIYCEIVEMK